MNNDNSLAGSFFERHAAIPVEVARMSYTFRMFDRMSDVPPADWRRVCAAAGDDPFTEPAFVELVEETLEGLTQTAVVVFYDERGTAVGGVCLGTCPIDAVMEAPAPLRRVAERVRRWFPNFLKFKLAMMGLPVTAEQEKLRLTPGTDRAEILRVLGLRSTSSPANIGRSSRCWAISSAKTMHGPACSSNTAMLAAVRCRRISCICSPARSTIISRRCARTTAST
ncbi:MAG: hypothetical protein QM775_02280 [Pirellulales bacterium]